MPQVQELRDRFWQELLNIFGEKISLNGHPSERLPNNVHLSFAEVEAETALAHLNSKGIYASAGSACTANEIEISHVLKAMKIPEKLAGGSIRFTFGKETTDKDIEITLKIMQETVESLRKIAIHE